jgi:rubrerythrin
LGFAINHLIGSRAYDPSLAFAESNIERVEQSRLEKVLINLGNSSFACLALLEDETCKLYEVMVEEAKELQTSLLLDVILQETRKHRELLNHLSRVFEDASLSPTETVCEGQLGQFFTQALTVVRSLKDEVLKSMPVAEAAVRLVDFERSASEEYLTELHVGLAATAEANQAVKRILEGIAEDEVRHVQILKLITEMAARK